MYIGIAVGVVALVIIGIVVACVVIRRRQQQGTLAPIGGQTGPETDQYETIAVEKRESHVGPYDQPDSRIRDSYSGMQSTVEYDNQVEQLPPARESRRPSQTDTGRRPAPQPTTPYLVNHHPLW
ncbi:hypothetical protein NP493_370g06028 [Ridgeia piscesae]|uniref:Uncharacterized protein n=1 Tax=Ridgeia piscesae TaxID=27915 RepID=A0AAD9L2K1_RIDPI|nr:hypothetical protein NP493_370g06028 [Ridgeia piscesae]